VFRALVAQAASWAAHRCGILTHTPAPTLKFDGHRSVAAALVLATAWLTPLLLQPRRALTSGLAARKLLQQSRFALVMRSDSELSFVFNGD
jgi:hypothetical protein